MYLKKNTKGNRGKCLLGIMKLSCDDFSLPVIEAKSLGVIGPVFRVPRIQPLLIAYTGTTEGPSPSPGLLQQPQQSSLPVSTLKLLPCPLPPPGFFSEEQLAWCFENVSQVTLPCSKPLKGFSFLQSLHWAQAHPPSNLSCHNSSLTLLQPR